MKSGIQMVQTCLAVKWSGFWAVVWKTDKNVHFYGLKCLVFEWSAKSLIRQFENQPKKLSEKSNIWISCVRYSNGYFIQLNIQLAHFYNYIKSKIQLAHFRNLHISKIIFNSIQWGSKFQPFKYWNHLKTDILDIGI